MYRCTCILGLGPRVQNKLRQQKQTNIQRFKRVFINVALTLIGYRIAPKLDYCFITSTSLVPVAVSTWI